MNRSQIFSKGLALVLALLLLPWSVLAQESYPTQYAPWGDYVLIVYLASDDPAVVNHTDPSKPTARFVKVSLKEMGLPIQIDDIKRAHEDITLRDKKGNEYTADTFGVSTVLLIDGQFSIETEQESFALYFDVPQDIPLEDLTLYVKTAVSTEFITVGLYKVPTSLEEDAPIPDPTEAPAAAPAEATLGQQLTEILAEDAYAQTYAALAEGLILAEGSDGPAIQGLHQALNALGASLSQSSSYDSQTRYALKQLARFFLPLDEEGNLSFVDAQGFEDLMLLLVLEQQPVEAALLLAHHPEVSQILSFYSAYEQVRLGNHFSAQQIYESLGDYRQSSLRAQLCPQPFPPNGSVYQKNADFRADCDLLIRVGGAANSATFVKIYTQEEKLVTSVFIVADDEAQIALAAGTYIIKKGTGTQWFGEAEAFGQDNGASYGRLYLDSGDDTILLESGYEYTLTLSTYTAEEGDDVSTQPESWSDF